MNLIKILLIGMSNNLGGIETYLYNLVKNSDNKRYQFDFLFANENEMALENEIKELGCHIYKVTPRYINRKKHIQEIQEIFKNNYDYIHYNIMSFSWFEPITIASQTNSKIIIHSHCSRIDRNVSFKTRMLHKLGKLKIRNISYLRVACGQDAGKFIFKDKKFTIFNNGIDVEKFKYDKKNRKDIREEFGIKENETLYGLVAAFLPVKNHNFLIDVFREINNIDNSSKLILIGEGKLKKEIEEKVRNLNIDNKVIFTGKRKDVNKFYSAMDILIMPSFSEGLSMSLIEAQANGLKCYTSDNIDRNSNITGNVEFLSLDKGAEFWAKYIYNSNNERDESIHNKMPYDYNTKKSCEKVYQFYLDNLK